MLISHDANKREIVPGDIVRTVSYIHNVFVSQTSFEAVDIEMNEMLVCIEYAKFSTEYSNRQEMIFLHPLLGLLWLGAEDIRKTVVIS